MKTVADFKRRLVLGARVRVTPLRPSPLTGRVSLPEVRTVSVVQTKQFATRRSDGREVWCDFPKARDFRVDGPNTVTLLDSDIGRAGEPFVTYEFLSTGACPVCRISQDVGSDGNVKVHGECAGAGRPPISTDGPPGGDW